MKNLGPLSKYDDGKPNFLKRFREKFKNGELDFCNEFNIEIKEKKEIITIDKINFKLNPKNIGYLFLNSIYNGLGIDIFLNRIKSDSKIEYDLNGLVKLFVFGRILDPQSKKKTFENRNKYLFPITTHEDENTIYRCLDILDKYSKQIQNRMNTKIKNSSIGRITNLTYYDVTNYYFETMYGDDDVYELDENNEVVKNEEEEPIIVRKGFKEKGVSKENSDGPIVQMGLFIDNNGIPVSHKLFPGNTQDKTTFKDVLEHDVDVMALGRIVIVADNGMNTQENKYLIVDKGNGYIVSKSVKRSWKKMGPWALNDEGYTEIKNSLGEVVFKYKSRINEIELTYKNEDGSKSKKKIKEKEIIYWSKKHSEKEVHQNKKFIEYLESCKENPDKLKDKERKSQQFIKTVDIDKETGEDDKEIINRYHGLSRIEDSFRIIRSDLEGRPIYVWMEEHIKAHFLICFIALTIIRIIQYKILKYENKSTLNVDGWEQGITAEKIRISLNGFKADQIYKDYYKITEINNEIDKILKSNNIDFKFKDYSIKEIKELRKLINNIVI